jgi:hypothetical protein
MYPALRQLPPDAALERTQERAHVVTNDWQKEDILEVLAWCEDASDSMDTITTELEYIVVSQLLKRCAEEIKRLRIEVQELKHGKGNKSSQVRRVQKNIRKR